MHPEGTDRRCKKPREFAASRRQIPAVTLSCRAVSADATDVAAVADFAGCRPGCEPQGRHINSTHKEIAARGMFLSLRPTPQAPSLALSWEPRRVNLLCAGSASNHRTFGRWRYRLLW